MVIGKEKQFSWFAVLAPSLAISAAYLAFADQEKTSLFSMLILAGIFSSFFLLSWFFLRLSRSLWQFYFAGCIALYLDIAVRFQNYLPYISTYFLRGRHVLIFLLLLFSFIWVLLRIFNDKMVKFFCVFFATVVICSFLISDHSKIRENEEVAKDLVTRSDLPLIIHIILDSHASLEGLPENIEGGKAIRAVIKDFYRRHQFKMFSKSYSHYKETTDSLSNMLNFDKSVIHHNNVAGAVSHQFYINQNKYFELIAKKEYVINVYGQYFIGHGSARDAKFGRIILEKGVPILALANRFEELGKKPLSVLSGFAGTFFSYSTLRNAYNSHFRPKVWQFLGIELRAIRQTWDAFAFSAFQLLDQAQRDILNSDGGVMYFLHLLTPHWPYMFDKQCNISEPIGSWPGETSEKAGFLQMKNTSSSREAAYKAYFEQLHCTYKKLDAFFNAIREAPAYQDATIIVHGDHGSRIAIDLSNHGVMNKGRARQNDSDDYFAHFAIKKPGLAAGTDESIRSIQDLFAETFSLQVGTEEPFVFDRVVSNEYRKRRPYFGHHY